MMWVLLLAPAKYPHINWVGTMIEFPIMVAVLLEVFASVFKPYSTLPKGTVKWFLISLGLIVLVTFGLAVGCPAAAAEKWVKVVRVLDRSAAILFCGGFAFTALFSSYFGIPWHRRIYGIGLGFLVYLVVDMCATTLAAMFGGAAGHFLPMAHMLGYSLTVILWLIHFAVPCKPRVRPTREEVWSLLKAVNGAKVAVSSMNVQLKNQS
jgi:hypothetical protein